jgi:hypothetical protein
VQAGVYEAEGLLSGKWNVHAYGWQGVADIVAGCIKRGKIDICISATKYTPALLEADETRLFVNIIMSLIFL